MEKINNPPEEFRYLFRISKNKLICAKPEEMTNYKMKFGSLCENCKIINVDKRVK